MPFDLFMELSLYDPDSGFFSAGAVRPGSDADFVTSPEVSPWFGRLLGRWVTGQCQGLDGGARPILVEVGGGSGSLLQPLVEEAGRGVESVFAVELSESARRSIADRVPAASLVPSVADAPGDRCAVVVVNEMLDNLPARLVQRTENGWKELRVGEEDGALVLVSVEAGPDISSWSDRRLGVVPQGAILAVQIRVDQWMQDLLTHFHSAEVLIIDYAAETSELAERRRADVVRSFARQQAGHDFLLNPGSTDVTVDVNTDVVVAIAKELGATVSVTDQRSFLMELGAGQVLEDLIELGHERARKGDVMGQLVVKSEATGLRALLDSSGLGSFTVFRISSGTRRTDRASDH